MLFHITQSFESVTTFTGELLTSGVSCVLLLWYDTGPHTGTADCDHLCPQSEDKLVPCFSPPFVILLLLWDSAVRCGEKSQLNKRMVSLSDK